MFTLQNCIRNVSAPLKKGDRKWPRGNCIIWKKKKWKQTQPNTLTSDASITNLNEALTTE